MISILLAVYNSEEWLPQCLNSLARQTADIEVIAVDDASTDGSLAILEDYARRDPRLRVIALKENGGQAHARNIALREARGEWVTMVDSDDWIGDLDTPLLRLESPPDCILLECHLTYADGHTEVFPLSRKEWQPEEAALAAVRWQGIHGLYIIRADIHRRFPYDEATKLYSDDNTARLHFLHSNRIVASNIPYFYRQHPQSHTHRVTPRLFDILEAHTSLQRTLEQDPLATPRIIQEVRNLRWRELTDIWHLYHTNRRALAASAADIESRLQTLYNELINTPVTDPIRRRFGYMRLRPYTLFRMQVKTYFRLRRMMGKE